MAFVIGKALGASLTLSCTLPLEFMVCIAFILLSQQQEMVYAKSLSCCSVLATVIKILFFSPVSIDSNA